MDDPFDLQRFVSAQNAAGAYEQALEELRAGHKRTHWIWFVFPQIGGLGNSPHSRRYALSGPAEARAYLAHPVLGPRLVECARTLAELVESDVTTVMGSSIDALKLRSSMTLFANATGDEDVFVDVLDKYFGGQQDANTLARL